MTRRLLALAHAITMFLAGGASAAGDCNLRTTGGHWPPYIYAEGTRRNEGMDIELAQAIFDQAGCSFEILDEVPTLRRNVLFQDGKIDLLMAASDTPARHAMARLSRPYRHETVRLFVSGAPSAQLAAINSVDSLRKLGITMLVPNAGWYGADYARLQERLKDKGQLRTFGNFAQGVRMLAIGRAQVMMGDAAAVRYAAAQAGLTLTMLPLVVYSDSVHMMLSKQSTTQAQLQRIDNAIAVLEANGTLKRIRAKYSGEP